jgi:hypothetical protein
LLTGFNTDIESDGVTYHVQTEDRGGASPLIESLVYMKGEILATRRTAYRELLEAGADSKAIRALMEQQHRAIVETIRSGRLDVLTEPRTARESDVTMIQREVPAERGEKAQRTLDEVIADWLAEQRGAERLHVEVQGGDELYFGAPFRLQLAVRTVPGDAPVGEARVLVRFLSTEMKAVILAESSTDAAGRLEVAGALPQVAKGTGLVVVTVQHARGSDEIKFLVKR